MKDSNTSYFKQDSFISLDSELLTQNLQQSNQIWQELTFKDVSQALCTLEIKLNASHDRIKSSEGIHSKQEYDCCRLLRPDSSSRLLLPLARRSRSMFSSQAHRLLCSNCTKIKEQQYKDILHDEEKKNSRSKSSFEITFNLELSSEVQNALNNNQYESSQTLIWNINQSDGSIIDFSYDMKSLNETEKKILLNETIKKLQILLNNRSTTLTEENPEITSHQLQTIINILSSSKASIEVE